MKPSVHIINCPLSWIKTPPLALIFLKNFLTAKNISCQLTDLNIIVYAALGLKLNQWLELNDDFEQTLFAKIKYSHPEIIKTVVKQCAPYSHIGFSLLKRNYPFSRNLAREIKNTYPGKNIIFGGPHTLFLDRQNQLDTENFWIIGEGETALNEILSGNPRKIYRFEEIENLDTLPFLNFDYLNRAQYAPVIPLLSSRGCPHTCAFCSERLLSKKFRNHSPDYIVEQIQLLRAKYNCYQFVFCDSMINYDYNWLNRFCQNIIAKKLDIQWEAQLRIKSNLTLDSAKLLKNSGCFNLFIGLESGSDHTLANMHKGFTVNCAAQVFETLIRAGLHFEISLIADFPEETDADFQETLSFIKTNRDYIPKIAQINPFVDYLNQFPNRQFPAPQGLQRVQTMVKTIQCLKIPYTKSFINNLIYPCRKNSFFNADS